MLTNSKAFFDIWNLRTATEEWQLRASENPGKCPCGRSKSEVTQSVNHISKPKKINVDLNPKKFLYWLVGAKFVLPFLLQSSLYEPHRDELLYLAESHHMAWGFMEVPPLLSVFAWITHVLGEGMFWIKCWPSLFGALTLMLTGKIILSIGGRYFALLLAFFAFVTGAYLRVHYLFQPNFLEIFFWTAMAYCLIRFFQTQKNRWLYALGLSIGLGLMSKYSVAFFALSLLLGLLATAQRKIFSNRHLYFALLLALAIWLPNLIWQWQHHFPVVYHMKELQQTQLQYTTPAGFLTDQVMMNLACVFVWITGLLWLALDKDVKAYRFIAWAYIFVIILLLLCRGKSYYTLGAYPVLFAFGAYRLEKLTSQKRIFRRYIFIAFILYIGYFSLPLLLPVFRPQKLASFYRKHHLEKTGALKWEDLQNHPLPQDFADMLGWDEMAQKTAAAYNTLDSAEKKRTILFCDNYGQAGALMYYAKKYHLPEAYSDNASFLYWIPANLCFDNIILVTGDRQEMRHPFVKDFQSAVLMDSITNPYAREKGSLIFLFKNGNDTFKKMFSEKIRKDQIKASW